MVAIAMTREMGTLGKDVAQGIADALDLKIIHSELVEHDLATRLGVQDSAVHRYLEGRASVLERWKIDKEKLSRYTAEEILEFARNDKNAADARRITYPPNNAKKESEALTVADSFVSIRVHLWLSVSPENF